MKRLVASFQVKYRGFPFNNYSEIQTIEVMRSRSVELLTETKGFLPVF